MKRSKSLISQALDTLKGNLERTGDPLGFKGIYWTGWADGLNLPRQGKTVLLTARMYQMLPYVIETTDMVRRTKPFLAVKGLASLLIFGNRLLGEPVIRLKARKSKAIKAKGERVLRGIVSALKAAGESPAYLYEEEPYSGVLLYDLGLGDYVTSHISKVYELFKKKGVEKIITVDPHTTFMLKEIYPKYIKNYDIEVKHYLELFSRQAEKIGTVGIEEVPKEFVIHDPCVMTRDLGIVEEARKLAARLGVNILEPENTKLDTACCGGPVEYAFAELSHKISHIRIEELSGVSRNILVTCPICLINLSKYEQDLGIKVWDMGEILHHASFA